jgi:hypothetical protein
VSSETGARGIFALKPVFCLFNFAQEGFLIMRRSLQLVFTTLLVLLGIVTVWAVEQSHDIVVTIPEYLELSLSEIRMDLGSFGELKDTLVTERPLKVSYRCNHANGWSLKVKASDFIHQSDPDLTFSVTNLSWGTNRDAINNQMSSGETEVAGSSQPVNTTTDIYYAVSYPGDNIYAGQYISEVTYTLVAL